jgi:lactoylglutathione lyase
MEFRYSGLFVRDVPSTVAFYQRAFGLGLRYMHPSNGYAELETGATLLAFVSEAFIEKADLLGRSEPARTGLTLNRSPPRWRS